MNRLLLISILILVSFPILSQEKLFEIHEVRDNVYESNSSFNVWIKGFSQGIDSDGAIVSELQLTERNIKFIVEKSDKFDFIPLIVIYNENKDAIGGILNFNDRLNDKSIEMNNKYYFEVSREINLSHLSLHSYRDLSPYWEELKPKYISIVLIAKEAG